MLAPALLALALSGAPTVVDHLGTLPDAAFYLQGEKAAPLSKARRLELVKVKDVKNGYLELKGPAAPADGDADMVVALFKDKASGHDVMAVLAERTQGDPCGDETCEDLGATYSSYDQRLSFWEWDGARWAEVTSRVLPATDDAPLKKVCAANWAASKAAKQHARCTFLVWQLPRKGTDLARVNAEAPPGSEPSVLKLHWKDGKFAK